VLDLIKVIILGIVEGVTEFLPISSTGHLIAAIALLQPFAELFPNDPVALNAYRDTFGIFIQLGAVVAIFAYYWREIWQQVRTVGTDAEVRRFWIALVIAFIPAALVGLALRGFIKDVLFSPLTVAISLIVGGVLLIVMERVFGKNGGQIQPVSYGQAGVVGVVQVLSLIPGVSRSAASIFGGMASGMNRETATRFSFYLAIPTLGLATVVDLLLSLDEISTGGSSGMLYLLIGAVVSGIVAWLAVRWLLRYIARHSFTAFGYYRIAAGIVLLALIALAVVER
jgi:undecaprenyl-diphosphatase